MNTLVVYSIPALLISYFEISKRLYIKKIQSAPNQFENFDVKTFKLKVLLPQFTVFVFILIHFYFFSNYMEKINIDFRSQANSLYVGLFVFLVSLGRFPIKDFFIRDNILYFPFGRNIELNNQTSFVKIKQNKFYTIIKLSYLSSYSKSKKKHEKLYIYNEAYENFDLNKFN